MMWVYLALGFIAGMGAGSVVFIWLIARLVTDVSTIVQNITHTIEQAEITRAD